MNETFSEKLHLNSRNKKQLEVINSIIEEYENEGYRLTLRQLYYQLVSRDIISNNIKEYAKLSKLLVQGRMAGIVDWNAIEDRIRVPYIPYWVKGIEDAISDTINQYRLDRQDGQDVYIELWVEKDALSGVLKRITEYYHIKLMVNRGYSSCTAMYDAYKRFISKLESGKKVVLLYLGDHDPSGLDMDRDIKNRLKEFIINSEVLKNVWHDKSYGAYNNGINEKEFSIESSDLEDWFDENIGDEERKEFYDIEDKEHPIPMMDKIYAYKIFSDNLEVRRIGLTSEQVKKYNPPTNPAKFKDPRAKDYVIKFGKNSWEVDALNPKILHELIKKNVEEIIDLNKFNKIMKQEDKDKTKLEEFRDERNK
jgi:hypothetical protein